MPDTQPTGLNPERCARAFGAAALQIRESQDMTQRAFAEVLGVSKSMVSFAENGKKLVPTEVGERIIQLAPEEERPALRYMLAASRLANGTYASDFSTFIHYRP